jgi:hypothetical protein
MRLPEFIKATASYGVKAPFAGLSSNQFYDDLLLLDSVGSGVPRQYSAWHVRRLVAWLEIGRLAGRDAASNNHWTDPKVQQRHQAMRLLASATEGFVVMSGGRAWWSLVPPVHAIKEMALVFPAIQWRPEHQPR